MPAAPVLLALSFVISGSDGALQPPPAEPMAQEVPLPAARTPSGADRAFAAAVSVAGAEAGWLLAFPATSALSLLWVSAGVDPLLAFAPVVVIAPALTAGATLLAAWPSLTPLGRLLVPSAVWLSTSVVTSVTGLAFLVTQGEIGGGLGRGVLLVTAAPALAAGAAAGALAPLLAAATPPSE